MAKDNNLKDFLTDVADAIREKEGSTGLINPQDFSAKIRAIETGGGGEGVAENDVNLRDYDGTIVYSYSKAQFLALTELPELPTHEGLTAQGWNWTLADAQSYVADNGIMEMSANYDTNDQKTRLYFSIPYDNYALTLVYYQSVSNGVRVLWGDGTTEEYLSSSGTKRLTHTYAKKGDYVCVIRVGSGTLSFRNSLFYASSWQSNLKGCVALKKAEISSDVTALGEYAFAYCSNLESISLPTSITALNNYAFYYCGKLRHITIPSAVLSLGNQLFTGCNSMVEISFPQCVPTSQALAGCYNLKRRICPAELIANAVYLYSNAYESEVALPKGATAVADYMFSNSYVYKVTLPDSVTNINNNAFYGAYYINDIDFPDSIVSLGASSFYQSSLLKFIAPSELTSIGSSAFYNCGSLDLADFRKVKVVPTLGSSNFNKGTSKIVVPDDLYDEWIAATNWSSLASKIVKASEYTD